MGYTYALGYEYGRRNCLTMDDTESGKTQERNEKGEYTKESDAAPYPEKENDNSSQLITDTSPKSLDRDIKANDGDHLKAARDFYRREYQDKHVVTKIDGKDEKVTFRGGGFREMRRDMKNNPTKALLVPYIADVIKTGNVTDFVKSSHYPYDGFYYFFKKVSVGEKDILTVVDVGRRVDGTLEYNPYSLNYDGFKNFEEKIANIEREISKKITVDSSCNLAHVRITGVVSHQPSLVSNTNGSIIGSNTEIVHISIG